MNFAKFSRRSLTVRGGYGIEATHKIRGSPLRPHAWVDYGRELHTDPVHVSAGMNAMPRASFSLDGLKPPADTAVLGVGAVADVHENMQARNSRVGTRRQTTQQQPQAQARLARMTVHPLGVMAPLFCLLNQALLLKLKLTIVLLLGLLLKAKVRLGAFSALGGLVGLLNLLVVTALVAALVLQQRQKPAAVG